MKLRRRSRSGRLAVEPADPVAAKPPVPTSLKIGAAILGIFVVVAAFAPLIATHDPAFQDLTDKLASPSAEHWLGTDQLGRDAFSRLVYAARTDLIVGFLAALFPLILGTTLGAIAGFFGGWVDTVISRVADAVQSFPVYVFLIALVFVLGTGVMPILVAFTAIAWVPYTRLIRTEILRAKGLDYVAAAVVAGLPHRRILFRHVLPNSVRQTVVYFMSDVILATVTLATLSFLGLGLPVEQPEWGRMISEGRTFLRNQWWLSTVPGLVIVALGMGYALIGDGLAQRLRGDG